MATITTLRPSGVASGLGWTAQPSGTLDSVTADDSDATWAIWSGTGSSMVLSTPVDSPPAGEQRHRVRIRARGEEGDAFWAVRLANGQLVAAATGQFTLAPGTVTGSWGFGAPPDGATVLSAYVTGQSDLVKIDELYLDVDTREAPTFTPEVLDGSDVSTTTVSDTTQPVMHIDTPDLDGLAARQFRYWVTSGATIIWDTGIVSGAPVDRETIPLDNGAYTAHFQMWTTLGSNTAYASDEETVDFTMSTGLVPAPDNPTVDLVDGTPFYRVTACAPFTGDFDGDQGYLEIQRVDCPSDPTMTTIAILGPLETGECADWEDFTLPRTDSPSVCDHPGEPCCSYYRARTVGRVDGALQISNWSDFFDPAIPLGLIVMWPGSEGTIPDGWNRVSALDGLYLKGVPDDSTDPGATGGAGTHTHTAPTHVHDTSHLHTTTTPTAAATGTVNTANTAGALKALTTHTHSRPSTSSTTLDSGTNTPAIGDASNDTERLETIYIQSDGTPLGVPDGALGHHLDTSVSGWADYTDATNRLIKGVIGAGPGIQVASGINSHSHSLAAHGHNGASHIHTSAATGSFSSTLAPATGSGAVLSAATHNHPITVNSGSSQPLSSGGSGSSGTAASSILPPYRNLRVKENTSGVPDLPVGLICAWRGSLGAIPPFWQLCDGTNGTPDMFGRYARGATASINTTGGSATGHTHTSPTHTHTTTGHSHTSATGTATGSTTAITTATVAIATAAHTHALVDTASTTPTVGSSTSGTLASTTQEPPFEEVAFIQLLEEPTPPPDPDLFCLDWDEDRHLIRTLGPDGPMWANVGGQFEWDVARPFTVASGVMGSRFVTTAPPGGRNLHMTAAVESEEELAILKACLDRPLVLISPSDAEEVWAAPVATSVAVIQIGRVRQVTADFIGTGPQPPPQLADVGV